MELLVLQAKYSGSVAMIGDGVNDSPALAQADIRMVAQNIAMETTGIVLVNSKLTDVVTATHLARTIYRRIRWKFVWALGCSGSFLCSHEPCCSAVRCWNCHDSILHDGSCTESIQTTTFRQGIRKQPTRRSRIEEGACNSPQRNHGNH